MSNPAPLHGLRWAQFGERMLGCRRMGSSHGVEEPSVSEKIPPIRATPPPSHTKKPKLTGVEGCRTTPFRAAPTFSFDNQSWTYMRMKSKKQTLSAARRTWNDRVSDLSPSIAPTGLCREVSLLLHTKEREGWRYGRSDRKAKAIYPRQQEPGEGRQKGRSGVESQQRMVAPGGLY